jgi:hypothetical protein
VSHAAREVLQLLPVLRWVHERGEIRFRPADRKVSAKLQYSIRF